MANGVPVKSIEGATDMQKKFLLALESEEADSVPKSERFRWAADQAGYAKTTSVTQIIQPIQHLLKDVAQRILDKGSIFAALQLVSAASDGPIDAQTRDRLKAAESVLDRSIPRKEAAKESHAPMAVLVLPVKQISKQLEYKGVTIDADFSSAEES